MNWIIVEKLLHAVEKEPQIAQYPAVKEKLNVLKEVVEDYTEHLQLFN